MLLLHDLAKTLTARAVIPSAVHVRHQRSLNLCCIVLCESLATDSELGTLQPSPHSVCACMQTQWAADAKAVKQSRAAAAAQAGKEAAAATDRRAPRHRRLFQLLSVLGSSLSPRLCTGKPADIQSTTARQRGCM